MYQCASIAEGDYIFKIDADLIFKPGWLEKSVEILDQINTRGALSLFNYRHYNPTDERFNILEEHDNYYVVDDFVSSIFGFKKEAMKIAGIPYQNDGYHQKLKQLGFLAITKEDYVENVGFGYGKSSFVYQDEKGQGQVTKMYDKPLIFLGDGKVLEEQEDHA